MGNATDGMEAAPADGVALRVLASGSRGNCSALSLGAGVAALLDLGLGPKRTQRLLAASGLDLDAIDDALLTHLDRDHFHRGWIRMLPARTRLHLHRRHASRAMREGIATRRLEVFDDEFALSGGARVSGVHVAHDQSGVAAFRIEAGDVAIGYATDLGRPSKRVAQRFAGVDLLAIESNYCPQMQRRSDRPAFLKRRITGGAGHLSNEECARLVEAIRPRERVVLLHLSQECNTPALASAAHLGRPYALTVSSQSRPTGWLRAQGATRATVGMQMDLFPVQRSVSAA